MGNDFTIQCNLTEIGLAKTYRKALVGTDKFRIIGNGDQNIQIKDSLLGRFKLVAILDRFNRTKIPCTTCFLPYSFNTIKQSNFCFFCYYNDIATIDNCLFKIKEEVMPSTKEYVTVLYYYEESKLSSKQVIPFLYDILDSKTREEIEEWLQSEEMPESKSQEELNSFF